MLFTFRTCRRQRRVAIYCFAGYLAFMVFSGAAFRSESPGFALFNVLFWGSWALLSLYYVVQSRKHMLTLTDEGISNESAFAVASVPWASIYELRWEPMHRTFALRGEERRIKLSLLNYELPEQIEIIRMLRERVPEERQVNWPDFCQRCAIRLIAPTPDPETDPRYVRVTSKRWNRWGMICAALLALVFFPFAWIYNAPQLYLAPAASLVFGLFRLFDTSEKESMELRLSAYPDLPILIAFGVLLFVVLFGGIALIRLTGDDLKSPLLWTFFGATLVAMCVICYHGDRREKRRRAAEQPESLASWERSMSQER